jgi:ABC-type branched-subunit amino acid transport system ATPase component
VVLLPTERAPYGDLTVRENVVAGAAAAPGCGLRGGVARAARADLVLGWFPSLAGVAGTVASALDRETAATLVVAVGVARAPRLLLIDGLAPYVGQVAYAAIVTGLRAASEGTSTVLADAVPAGADPVMDPAAFDRAFLLRDGALRPWFAAARAAETG